MKQEVVDSAAFSYNMSMKKERLILYSLFHLLVDFSCTSVVLHHPNWCTILLYNCLAFGLELPIGIFLDRFHHQLRCASIGCLLVFIGILCIRIPLLTCLLAGVGNAMFHVGAGSDVLYQRDERCGDAGIFVSTGALGLFLGKVIPAPYRIWIAAIGMVTGTIYFNWIQDTEIKTETGMSLFGRKEIIVLITMFFAILLRAHFGAIFVTAYPVCTVCAVVAGKMMGGILADRFGRKRVGMLSLGLSGFLLLASSVFPLASVFAIFLYNFTMPLTLSLLCSVLKGQEGYAFGILTFALLTGTLPTLLGLLLTPSLTWLFTIVLATLGLYWIGERAV